MYQDCELGEELYEALREFNQEREDKWRTAEGKQLSFEFGGNFFEMGFICAPALDMEFMKWYRVNQDLDFQVMLEEWQRGYVTQQQREIA